MFRKVEKYFAKHTFYNSAIHFLGGVGVGIIIARPIIGVHPVRWGIAFILIAVWGHVYPLTLKK